jgi:hypothetical protein
MWGKAVPLIPSSDLLLMACAWIFVFFRALLHLVLVCL